MFDAKLREAKIFYDKGEYNEVLRICDEILRSNQKNDAAWMQRGAANRELGFFGESIQDCDKALRLNPKNYLAFEQRGASKIELGFYEDAIFDLTESLKLNPKCYWARMQRGIANRLFQRYSDAIHDFTQAINLNAKNAWGWEERGAAYRALNQYEDAIRDLNKAVELNPKSAFAWIQRGTVNRALNQCREAILDLNQGIILNPNSAFAWMQRGAAKRALNQLDGAIHDLSEAIRLNPRNYWAWEQRGTAKRSLNQYEEAIQDFNEVILINPSSAWAWEQCGAANRQLNRFQQAILCLTEALKLDPTSDFARKQLELARTQLAESKKVSVLSPNVVVDSLAPSAPTWSACFQGGTKMPAEMYVDPMSIPRRELIFGRCLGEGGFGEVFQCEWVHSGLLKTPVAVKQLKLSVLSHRAVVDFKKEVAILAKLDSSAVVKLFGITAEEAGKPCCMVMEFMELGSLRETLIRMEPAQLGWDIRLQIAKDIATGLVYLHGQNPMIVHGDIKSLNILLNNQYRAKIGDFGLASLRTEMSSRYYVQDAEGANKAKGSLLWMAPELFKMNAKRTRECDMFSYAVVLWELASHKLPYRSAQGDEGLIKSWVRDGDRESFDDETTPGTPDEYREVTAQCWRQTPVERLTASSALKSLENIQVYGKNSTVRVMFPPQGNSNNSNNSVTSLSPPQKKYF